MKILAIDTSGRQAGVAVVDGCAVLCAQVVRAIDDGGNWKHSQQLLPAIAAMLAAHDVDAASLECVAYTCGPGSFTGLRIGAATALGLARGWNLPTISVPTLDAMAYNEIIMRGAARAVAMLDARRGQVYAAVYARDAAGGMVRTTDYLADAEEAVVTLAGDATVIRDVVEPAAVGLWAVEKALRGEFSQSGDELLYVRAPQAVRERAAREGAC